jgi:hypothetical protein
MKQLALIIVFVFPFSLLASGFALAADDSKVKAATEQVEGIGNTVSEGAKYSGEKLKDAGKAAEPPAKTAWGNARDGAVNFGHSVKGFFTNLFSN